MGRRIITLSLGSKELGITGAIENKGHPAIGKSLSDCLGLSAPDIKIGDNPGIIKD
jgi:hypothetical protein